MLEGSQLTCQSMSSSTLTLLCLAQQLGAAVRASIVFLETVDLQTRCLSEDDHAALPTRIAFRR